MKNQKIYLLAELTVLPELLDDVKPCSSNLSFVRLKSPVAKQCSLPHERAIHISWSSLRSSPLRRHISHLEQDYTKRMFAALEGKLAGAPVMTNLNALQRG